MRDKRDIKKKKRHKNGVSTGGARGKQKTHSTTLMFPSSNGPFFVHNACRMEENMGQG